jgi:arylsulfatase A-like enzyme
MYETIHTGLSSSQHGIVANLIVRPSTQPNLFGLAMRAGKVTAAAAYYWFSELYNRAPYDRINDREVDDPSLPIQRGRFYIEDEYPDAELFAAAAMLAPLLLEWMERGYIVLVTGDHGLNRDGAHGGPALDQREVPLYVVRPNLSGLGDTGQTASHLQIAPTVLNLLEIPIPDSMKYPPLM